MRNPFPNNEVFEKFLGLKDYFKDHQTKESSIRIREIARVGRVVRTYGDTIAFDLLGSVNFGMADKSSDVDMVLYLDCPEIAHEDQMSYENCPQLRFYEALTIHSLVHAISKDRFKVEVVDSINLAALEIAINNENLESDIIPRFVFYRTICRGINKRYLHKLEKMILGKPKLLKDIEESLTDVLIEFTRSASHGSSFKKYMDRMQENDIHIPNSVVEKVMEYLAISKH